MSKLKDEPKASMKRALEWITCWERPASAVALAKEFAISLTYASVILFKLHKWGYLKRSKATETPRTYRYVAAGRGRKLVERWSKE